MALCDQCYAPGICCKNFGLFDGGNELSFWLRGNGTVKQHLAENKLPFIPSFEQAFVDGESNRKYGNYSFSCSKLTPEGRCSIHQDRPQLCRDLEPAGGSPLCVHSGGAEGTADGL